MYPPTKANSHVFPSGADISIASDACPCVTHLLIEGAASGDQSNLHRHLMYGSIPQIPAREALSPALAEEWWAQGLGSGCKKVMSNVNPKELVN